MERQDHLGGHSWGGKVAWMIAALHSEAAESLLLFDPSPASSNAIPPETFVDATLGGELGPWTPLDAAKDSVRHLQQYANWSEDLERAFERGIARGDDGRGARGFRERRSSPYALPSVRTTRLFCARSPVPHCSS